MKIGITGTIAAGKSSVSILLRRRGMPVFNADNYAKTAYVPGSGCWDRIMETFGTGILDEHGDVDKQKMADLIFTDEEKRKQLNAIVHPYTTEGMHRFFERNADSPFVFAEVPLLFEAGLEDEFDRIVVVTCSKETAVARMMRDRDYTREEAERRYGSQIDPEIQKARADMVLYNDGSLRELDAAVNKWVGDLRREMRNGSHN